MRYLKTGVLTSSLFLLMSCSNNEFSEIKDVRDIRSIELRSDDRYDVVCRDGSEEIVTAEQIEAGDVCGNRTNPSGEGSLRLNSTGLMEYFYNEDWRGVCDDNFGENEARVACQQLGGEYISFESGRSGPSSSFWLDNLSCQGDESRLDTCNHNGFGSEDCGSDEWIKLNCSGLSTGLDSIRLTANGLVEVKHEEEWRGVCDDNFGENEARVACQQLGGEYVSFNTGRNGPSSNFWLDNLSCQGNESTLGSCNHNGYGSEDCGSDEWVQLSCTGLSVGRDSIRLAPGGLIEVKYNEEWRGVCDDSFDANDGQTACRQLGMNYVRHTTGESGPSGNFWLDNLGCSGSENSLFECSANTIGSEDCGSDEWVKLICN